MSVTFKRVQRKNPQDQAAPAKYYPQLVVWGKPATLESLSIQMKEKSSLTLGDIQSVLTNFVSAMRTELYNGHSVSIDGFGVFSLSATTEGSEQRKDCTAEKIKAVRINFRASSAIRPNLDTSTTRAEERIDFVDLDTKLQELNMTPADGTDDEETPGGGGSEEGGGEDPLG